MKYLLFILMAVTAEAKECKIIRTDNVVLYGHCLKAGETVMFYSCAEFSCQVPSEVTRSLDKKEETCKLHKTEQALISEMKQEHGTDDLSKVSYCQYTESLTGLVVDEKKSLVDQVKEVLKKQK